MSLWKTSTGDWINTFNIVCIYIYGIHSHIVYIVTHCTRDVYVQWGQWIILYRKQQRGQRLRRVVFRHPLRAFGSVLPFTPIQEHNNSYSHTHKHTQPDTKHWGVFARASTYILYLWNEETRHRNCFYVQLTISAAATAIAMNSDIILQAKSYYPYSSAHERMTRFMFRN